MGPTADNSTGALPVVPALPSTGPPPAVPQPNPVEGAGTGPLTLQDILGDNSCRISDLFRFLSSVLFSVSMWFSQAIVWAARQTLLWAQNNFYRRRTIKPKSSSSFDGTENEYLSSPDTENSDRK